MDQALTCSWRILISIKLEQLEFKLEKIIRIQKHAGEVGKLFIFLLQDENINITQVFPSNVNFRFQRIHFELVRFSFLENNSLNTIIPQFFCFSRCLPKNPLGQKFFEFKKFPGQHFLWGQKNFWVKNILGQIFFTKFFGLWWLI